jgi:hypothetical protein
MISLHKAACNAAFDVIFGDHRYPVSFRAVHTTKEIPENDNPMSTGNGY